MRLALVGVFADGTVGCPDKQPETAMRGVVMYTAGDVRVEEREEPEIIDPTDAIIRLTATSICGSDLWPYRGVERAGSSGHGTRVRRRRRGDRLRGQEHQ